MKHNPVVGLASWCHVGLIALSIIIFILTYNLPMLSTPGFESANLYVLCLGPLLALCAACNKQNFISITKRELSWLLLHVFFISSLIFVHSYFVTNCSQGAGLGIFFIILIPPLFVNTIIGCLLSGYVNKLSIKIILWALLYLAYFGFKLHYWWHETPFRFLSNLSILITSDLVEGAQLTPAAMSFRIATLFWGLALLALGSLRFNFKNILFFIAFSAGAWFLQAQSLEILNKTKRQLKEDYSLNISKNNIIIHANPDKTSQKEIADILDEALFYQDKIKNKLGNLSEEPIIIWLHANDTEKALYTGAKNVHFAQPQHREIHISESTTPHGVLGHELAHIFVGEYSDTYWKMPGRWWLIPNLALSEGLAMALTPELVFENNLNLMQQAQALHQANLSINIKKLFSSNPISFIKNNFRSAYIFAGAFLYFYLDKFSHEEQKRELQKIARSGSLSNIFNSQDLDKILKEFSAHLDLPIEEYALLWAKRNFGSMGIINSDCTKTQNKTYELFWQNIINNNILDAFKNLSNLKPEEQINLALKSLRILVQKNYLQSALEISAYAQEIMQESQDIRLDELYFEQLQILLQIKKFFDARILIKKININKLNPGAQRQLVIQKQILHELEENININQERLLILTLNFLTNFFKPEKSKLELVYILGSYSGPESLGVQMARYVYARMLINSYGCEEALIILQKISHISPALPNIILEEIKNLKANCFFKLKNYDQARIIFLDLLTSSQNIIYKDKLERINFYEKQ